MKLKECFERIGCGERDVKARRVSNVSKRVANISADEIEKGVSLERLAEVNVPVFRYFGQITIHGKLPDFDPESRPLGYKAVFRNGNGSVGVRYVAVDAAKKDVVKEASRFGKEWSAHINSQGLSVSKFFMEKADCLAGLEFLRGLSGLFYGSISAGATMMGGYVVYADIGAIPQDNLWKLIEALWGFKSQADVDAAEAAYSEKRALESAKYEAERKKENEEHAKKVAAGIEDVKAMLLADGFAQVFHVPDGQFVIIGNDFLGEIVPFEYKVERGPFGRCYYSKKPLEMKNFSLRRKVAAPSLQGVWARVAREGRMFA